MPDPLTPDERAELRVLCEQATPEPWRFYGDGAHGPRVSGPDLEAVPCDDCGDQVSIGEADGRFIAAARTALPRLLDALEQAERDRDSATATVRMITGEEP